MESDIERDENLDEYLWPLTGAVPAVDWSSLSDELQIRTRLAEIITHVRTTHLARRLRRLGTRPSATLVQATTQALITGPVDGQPWEQTLKEPVPRALCDEWADLGERLQRISQERARTRSDGNRNFSAGER